MGGVLAAVITAGLGAAAIAEGEAPATGASDPPTGGTTAEEAVDRLGEILRVHDAALLAQDASLLDGVFHPDCACAGATRDRIHRLRDSGFLWSDYESTISDAEAHQQHDGTWAVTATLTGSATRVETEDHELVRILPGDRRRWEFHLRRAASGGPLLLTTAEPRS